MTRYIITGAAGHLGSTVARLLLERGAVVRGLLLHGEQPVVPGAEYIHGDVLEPDSLAPLFRREQDEKLAVIHTAGIIDVTGKMSQRLYDVNVIGTKNIVALCSKYHVDKLVYVSSVHAIPETGKPVVQAEVREFSPDWVVGGYAKTKAEATQAVLDAANHGLPAVVVHPSGIIGPYDEGRNHLVQMVRDFMEGKLPVCVKGGYDLVDVRDVAAGCILAAKYGHIGECYILSGEYQGIREILDIAGAMCGRKAPFLLPMPLIQLAEPILSVLARKTGHRPLYTQYSLNTVKSKTRFSAQKARNELGYTARDTRISIQDTVQWFRDHQ